MRIVDFRGKWTAVFYAGGERQRRSLGYDATPENMPAAKRACADLERALAQPESDIVTDVVEAYLADSKAVTIGYMKWMWKVIKPHCDGLRVDQITRDWCRQYVAKRGKATATVRKEIGLIATAIKWAGKPGAVIELPPQGEPRDRWLTKKEFYRLLDAAEPHPHLIVFLHIAIATGARKEAILDLTWERVNFTNNQIYLGKKAGGKARAIVPMTKRLREVLLSHQKTAEKSGYVVEYAGEKVGDIKKAFATAVRNAGLENVTPHDLRHTAAVWMAANGVDFPKIAQFLGHRDSKITERVYARFAPEHLRDAAAALEV